MSKHDMYARHAEEIRERDTEIVRLRSRLVELETVVLKFGDCLFSGETVNTSSGLVERFRAKEARPIYDEIRARCEKEAEK